MHEPWAIVSLDQVAEHISTIDLGITGSAYINKSIIVAQYLGNRGLLERHNDGWRLFSITQPGINEVEREISTQRASANQSVAPTDRSGGRRERHLLLLEAVYDLAGTSTIQFVYWQNLAPRLGWDAEGEDDLEEALGIADYLANSCLITIEVSEGTVCRITNAGIDAVEE